MKRWQILLAVVIVSAVGIQLFEPDYTKLQTAKDAADFRQILDSRSRAVSATISDIVFAAAYGTLGVLLMRSVAGRSLMGRLGAISIAAAAVFDELENLLLLRNIAGYRSLTDGQIDLMQVPGTLKWIGIPGFLLLFFLLIRRAIRR